MESLETNQLKKASVADGGPEARSLTSRVYGQLRRDIITCVLRPGVKLRINDLQIRFDVSLSAIREALSRLASDGLVVAADQRGFRVSPVSLADLNDVMRTRVQIECLALQQSIKLGDLDWEARVAATYYRLSRLPRASGSHPEMMSDDWADAHGAFHRSLVEACQSPWLLNFRDTLYEQTERYRRLTVNLEPARDVLTEHEALMAATLARQADKAASVLEEHLGLTAQILVSYFKANPIDLGSYGN